MERWFTPAALARASDPAVEYARQRLLADDPNVFAAYWRAMSSHDVEAQLKDIRMPVTVIAGSLDAAAPVTALQAIADRIPGSRFEIIPGPHMLQLEEPTRFRSAVRDHLRWAALRA
jgi:pimeloyl-ACP methyl ester carboxylesterase